jgi:hypothetical protein
MRIRHIEKLQNNEHKHIALFVWMTCASDFIRRSEEEIQTAFLTRQPRRTYDCVFGACCVYVVVVVVVVVAN